MYVLNFLDPLKQEIIFPIRFLIFFLLKMCSYLIEKKFQLCQKGEEKGGDGAENKFVKYLHFICQLFKTEEKSTSPCSFLNGTLAVFPILLIFTSLPSALECFEEIIQLCFEQQSGCHASNYLSLQALNMCELILCGTSQDWCFTFDAATCCRVTSGCF